jgi:hypothetical protein
VPGIEKDGDVGALQQLGEVAHLVIEGALVEVDPEEDVEARSLERGRDLVGVIDSRAAGS